MHRFAIALLMALYVGVVPFALEGSRPAMVIAGCGLTAIVVTVKRLAVATARAHDGDCD